LPSIRACTIERMNDNIDMETSKKSRSAEEPESQVQPAKDEEEPLKNEALSPASAEAKDEATDETAEGEPGTFDRVYEHGRQMGF
jgi:hypothetical protein